MSIAKTYIEYGVRSDWADNYEKIGISSGTFKQTSAKNLIEKYNIPKNEIAFVKDCLKRQPIDEKTYLRLLQNSNYICCMCIGIKSDAYVIHHIVKYSKTKDNSYKNLAVLCPSDHDLAHREGVATTSGISEAEIIETKKKWELEVKKRNTEKAIKKTSKREIKDWKKINPYKELQSYSESDQDYFFGRKEEIQELVLRIDKYKIVGLFGESGTGKTSMVNAGLIPILKNASFIPISVRCLDDPIKRLKESLFKVLKSHGTATQAIEKLATADNFPHLIIELKLIIEKDSLDIIVIIDQFEEIFTRAGEAEREQFAKGLTEALIGAPIKGNIYFLLSLREDYIGQLWDWSHKYNLEVAWIHQYRIKRLTENKALEVIVEPLHKLNIKTDELFIRKLISELKKIGDDLIYPPYLQIVCSALFEKYKNKNTSALPTIKFGKNLYEGADSAESIIADYLNESLMDGLTDEEKIYAENILDLLTGGEGLRSFLTLQEISRYIKINEATAKHIVEQLIKKKIVHPVIEKDKITGYELVHDFLSKKFFEKLSPEAKSAKTTIEIFRKAFKDWQQHGVLASKDRLEILFENIKQLSLNESEWLFLIKSSFSVYWYFENKWIEIIEKETLAKICMGLITDKESRIVENSIHTLAKVKGKEVTLILKKMIESPKTPRKIQEEAIRQFSYNIVDTRILDTLKEFIKNGKNYKLRKNAVHAFAHNLHDLSKLDEGIVDKEISILYDALDDSMSQVRKQVADVLSYLLVTKKSVSPLIQRIEKEKSALPGKAIINALGALSRRNVLSHQEAMTLIAPTLQKISSSDSKEDYRVKEEAKNELSYIHKQIQSN